MTADRSGFLDDTAIRAELASAVRWAYQRGWTPATSSNFSARLSETEILVSASGIVKEHFAPEHLLRWSLEPCTPPAARGADTALKPSAEAALHACVYKVLPARAVLHVHSPSSTVMSRLRAELGAVELHGYELLKAFSGVRTHDVRLRVPIFANQQNMPALADLIMGWLVEERAAERASHAFLIEGHGVYTWGASIEEAKRHLEALEFLLDCEFRHELARPAARGERR